MVSKQYFYPIPISNIWVVGFFFCCCCCLSQFTRVSFILGLHYLGGFKTINIVYFTVPESVHKWVNRVVLAQCLSPVADGFQPL